MILNNYNGLRYMASYTVDTYPRYYRNAIDESVLDTSGNPVKNSIPDSSSGYLGGLAEFINLKGYVASQTETMTYTGINGSIKGYADIVIGSGTTAPTATDYCMSNQIYTDLSSVSFTRGYSTTSHTGLLTRIFQNTGSQSITVSEIGVISWLNFNYISGSSSTVNLVPVLLTRSVLAASLTVPSGGYFTIVVGVP